MSVLVEVGQSAFVERLTGAVESALVDCVFEVQGGCSGGASMIDSNHAIAVIIKQPSPSKTRKG